MTDIKLRQVLESLRLQDKELSVEGRPGRWLAQVMSQDFATMSEAERQSFVWEHLLQNLPEYEVIEVEFILTMTPEEVQQLNQQAAS